MGVSGKRTVVLFPSVFTRMSKAVCNKPTGSSSSLHPVVEKRNEHGVACRLRVFKRIRQLGRSCLLRGKCRRLPLAKHSSKAATNASFLRAVKRFSQGERLRFIIRHKNRWGGMNSHVKHEEVEIPPGNPVILLCTNVIAHICNLQFISLS
jgi:hypothetical protein